ncbi:hypothetical protein WR25_01439 [Diploscapter pachys]|uniref:Uncharacterized protein n=1 Tax=Diploscapter pachys TaxID=2018661 RepID=A0A2A2JP33_9BILA|nr:hypothetical protein WR25_01439 [Diploscapter pachys]
MNYSKVIAPSIINKEDNPTTSSSGFGSSTSATTPTSSRKTSGFARLLRQHSKNDGERSGSVSPSSEYSIPPPSAPKPKKSGFASRSVRKREWRLFKHRTFFGSTRGSTKRNHNNNNNNQL